MAPRSDSYAPIEAAAISRAASRVNGIRLRTYVDVPKFPSLATNAPLPTNATPEQLLHLYRVRHQRYLYLQSASLDGNPMGEQRVPVTPAFRANATYHIIVLKDNGRGPRGPEIELLVREADNYLVGWRIIIPTDPNANAQWYVFSDVELPLFFGEVIRTKYNSAYGPLDNILISRGVLNDIYNFLIDFPNQPLNTTTNNGKRLLETLFIIVGEGQRFAVIQSFILENIARTRVNAVLLPKSFVAVIQNWASLSKAVFYLNWLETLEDALAQNISERLATQQGSIRLRAVLSQIAENKLHVKKNLTRLEKAHGSILKFRGPAESFSLTALASELYLLKHEDSLIKRILMRLDGYQGVVLL